jgi:predicted GNAT family acetyltransferase
MPALRTIVDADPIAHCFVASRFADWTNAHWQIGAEIIGYEQDGSLEALLYCGANLIPIATTAQSRSAFADWLRNRTRRSSSIVGNQEEVLDLWRQLEPAWGPAREVRATQPFLRCDVQPAIPGNPQVRPASMEDMDLLVPACVHMFTEEVGVSPYRGGGESSYRARIAELVESGRAFVWIDGDQIIFKAEIGAVSDSACQLQGVWVHPSHRGYGLASGAIAQVVALAQALAPTVVLYVNDFNVAARKAYNRVGFTEHTRFATVLF